MFKRLSILLSTLIVFITLIPSGLQASQPKGYYFRNGRWYPYRAHGYPYRGGYYDQRGRWHRFGGQSAREFSVRH